MCRNEDMFVSASVEGRYSIYDPRFDVRTICSLRFAWPFQLNGGRAGACTSALQQTSSIWLNSKHHLPVFRRFKGGAQRHSWEYYFTFSAVKRQEKKSLCFSATRDKPCQRFTKKLTNFQADQADASTPQLFPPRLSANSNWFLGTLKMAPIPALIMHLRVLVGPQSAADIQSTA